MNIIKESVGNGKYIIQGTAVRVGRDINISIGGGEGFHIGAVGVAVPREETKKGKKRSATTSVICVQGHREDELAHYASKHLATVFDCVVTVSVGIHIDDAEERDIRILSDNFMELVKELESSLLKVTNKIFDHGLPEK